MSLRPKKGHVAVAILGVHIPLKDSKNALEPVLTHFWPFKISIFLNFLYIFLGKHKTITKVSRNIFEDSNKCNIMPRYQFQKVILLLRLQR